MLVFTPPITCCNFVSETLYLTNITHYIVIDLIKQMSEIMFQCLNQFCGSFTAWNCQNTVSSVWKSDSSHRHWIHYTLQLTFMKLHDCRTDQLGTRILHTCFVYVCLPLINLVAHQIMMLLHRQAFTQFDFVAAKFIQRTVCRTNLCLYKILKKGVLAQCIAVVLSSFLINNAKIASALPSIMHATLWNTSLLLWNCPSGGQGWI